MNDSIYFLIILNLIFSFLFFKFNSFKYFSIRGITVTYFTIFYPIVIAMVILESILFFDSFIDEPLIIIDTLCAYLILIGTFLVIEICFIIIKFSCKKEGIIKREYRYEILQIGDLKIMWLAIFYLIALFVRLYLDVYYHVSINPDYNTSVNNYQSLINRLHWLGLLPIFLFQFKFFKTGKVWYLVISVIMLVAAVGIYLPSGSRTTALLFVPVFMIFAISRMKSHKISFIIIGALVISILLVFAGKLRVTDNDFSESGFSDDVRILVHRLSDSLVTGRIIEKVPSEFDFRGGIGMEALLVTPFPRVLRTVLDVEEDFLDGVRYIWHIGLSGPWTSVPVTLLGDFYSRFGWYGIWIFSLFLGLWLKLLEIIISRKCELFRVVFISLYSAYLSQIYIVDLQVLFVSITREFLIAYLLATILTKFLKQPPVAKEVII